MASEEDRFADLKRSYQILGVPVSASAHSIKQAYHHLVKRWHPDRYSSGTPSYAEATKMMALINEAYSRIAHAPLRYHINSYPAASQRRAYPVVREAKYCARTRDTLPITSRLEFWVRFVSGAVLGIFMSVSLVLSFYDTPKLMILGSVGLIVGCAFSSAFLGDRFWRRVLEYGWLWW